MDEEKQGRETKEVETWKLQNRSLLDTERHSTQKGLNTSPFKVSSINPPRPESPDAVSWPYFHTWLVMWFNSYKGAPKVKQLKPLPLKVTFQA